MQITGKNGAGSILRFFLQIGLVLGIIFLIALPFILQVLGINMNASMFVIYPNGIVLLIMLDKFIKLLNSLKINNPFCDDNVRILKSTVIIALVEALLWLLDLIYMLVLVKSEDIIVYAVLIFLSVLFIGVALALYIVCELFKEAVNYKKENELTI